MRKRVAMLVVLAFVGMLPAVAQQSAVRQDAPTGVVTGRVSCADTNMPARFAMVTLEPVPPEKTEGKSAPVRSGGNNATATTDLEGRFAMDKVAPGKYYVLGTMAGYLNPLARFGQDELAKMTDETRKKLAATVPVIEVTAAQPVAVDLQLERAAEISGTVEYDDASPAVGVKLVLLRKGTDGKLTAVSWSMVSGLGLFGAGTGTDDRGRFRLVGMPPGEYVVSASLPSQEISVGGLLGGHGMSVTVRNHEEGALTVYSGSVFRKRDAKLIKVGEAEAVGGVDISFPLAGLCTVKGEVSAVRDGHTVNKAQVQLLYADDREQVRSVQVEPDGSFQLSYLPQDKYILRVVGAADTVVETKTEDSFTYNDEKVVHSYGEAEQPLMVLGDTSGVGLAVPELKK
jgi:hypothetical protein